MPAPRPTLDFAFLVPAGGPDPAKLALLALVALYLAGTVLDPERGNLVGGIIFYTHEAGHWLFRPFGDFLTTAGGTITQLALPVAFAIAFVRQGQPFSAAITLFWLAMAWLASSLYAGDAIALERPLSTTWTSGQEELEAHGETGHDWFNMLSALGLLEPHVVSFLAGAQRLAGTLTYALALYLGLLTAGLPVPARLALPAWPRKAPPRKPKRKPKRKPPAPRRRGPGDRHAG